MQRQELTGSRLLARVPPLRRVAPSHSLLAVRRDASALRAASWQARWIRFQWDTVLCTCQQQLQREVLYVVQPSGFPLLRNKWLALHWGAWQLQHLR